MTDHAANTLGVGLAQCHAVLGLRILLAATISMALVIFCVLPNTSNLCVLTSFPIAMSYACLITVTTRFVSHKLSIAALNPPRCRRCNRPMH